MDATPDFSRKDGITIGLNKTKHWVRDGIEVIYEAAVSAGGTYAAMDILVKEGKGWRAVEVKSITTLKNYHINDTALQYYAFKQAGINLVDIEVMYIKKEYVRNVYLDLDQLFVRESVLELVLPLQSDIPRKIESFTEMLRDEGEPEMEIGLHCDEPFACDFRGHCLKRVPDQNVFDLARIGKRGWQLYKDGYVGIKDIPDNLGLSTKQRNQVNGAKYGKSVFEAEAIREFLVEWVFPLYFFDFETIGPAVLLFDGTRPYQQYAHQYSLHILPTQDGDLTHLEFLAEPAGDPREALIKQMISDLGSKGSIVIYNMGFEKGKIKDLAEIFPEHSTALMAIYDRVVDLYIPFRSHSCYTPDMKGSASIKSVFPALVPKLSYKDVTIQEGVAASEIYMSMLEGRFEGNQEKTLEDLKAYCKLDTLAMVEIWSYLIGRLEK